MKTRLKKLAALFTIASPLLINSATGATLCETTFNSVDGGGDTVAPVTTADLNASTTGGSWAGPTLTGALATDTITGGVYDVDITATGAACSTALTMTSEADFSSSIVTFALKVAKLDRKGSGSCGTYISGLDKDGKTLFKLYVANGSTNPASGGALAQQVVCYHSDTSTITKVNTVNTALINGGLITVTLKSSGYDIVVTESSDDQSALGCSYLDGTAAAALKSIEIQTITTGTPNVDMQMDYISISSTSAPTVSVAVADNYEVERDTTLAVVDSNEDLLANDTLAPATDKVKSGDVTTTEGVTVTLGEDGSFSYTPNSGFVGSDSFTYEIVATDGSSYDPVITGTATINVTSSTVAVDDSYNAIINGTAVGNVLANDTNELSLSVTKAVNQLTIYGQYTIYPNGDFIYMPEDGFNGNDSFTYQLGEETATVTITVADYAVDATPVSAGATISTAAGWNSGSLPTLSAPGNVNIDALTTNVTFNGVAFTIASDVTLERTGSGGRIDFTGSTNIVVDGTLDLIGSANVSDGVTSSRWEGDTLVTVREGGLLKIDDPEAGKETVLILRDNSHLNVLAGTVELESLTLDTAGTRLTVASDSTVNIATALTVTSGLINFTKSSTGAVDVDSFTDEAGALNFWTGLWNANKLTYNGITFSEAANDFSDFFQIDVETFALKVQAYLSPVYDIEVAHLDGALTWQVAEEFDIKEYRVVNTATGQIIEIIEADGSRAYSAAVSANMEVELIVVDNSGYTQSYSAVDNDIETVKYELAAGWNLITVIGENTDISELYAATTGEFWGWNGNSYELVTAPQPTQGIWVYAPAPASVSVTGTLSDRNITLLNGWNLVGPVNNCSIPEEADIVYGWKTNYEQILKDAEMLIRGVGYWIFTTEK